MEFASGRQCIIASTQLRPEPTRQCAIYTRIRRSISPWEWSFPPFQSDNYNPNPTPGNFVSLLFGWNWNANNPLGTQNLGLAYSGSSSQQLGTNPSFGPVGSTNPVGQQSLGGQPSVTAQTNVGFNPHLAQSQGGTTGPSHQPLGHVQPLSQFQ